MIIFPILCSWRSDLHRADRGQQTASPSNSMCAESMSLLSGPEHHDTYPLSGEGEREREKTSKWEKRIKGWNSLALLRVFYRNREVNDVERLSSFALTHNIWYQAGKKIKTWWLLEWNWNMCAITAVLQIAFCNKLKNALKSFPLVWRVSFFTLPCVCILFLYISGVHQTL